MAQLPLDISGKLFTTMKKALFHGRLRVFGEKMNTSVYRLSHATSENFQKKPREYAIIGAGKPPPGFSKKLSILLSIFAEKRVAVRERITICSQKHDSDIFHISVHRYRLWHSDE